MTAAPQIAGISVHHPGVGQHAYLMIRYVNGGCSRWAIEDDGYACRMGCMLVDAGVTNINSRPQPAGSGPNKEKD